VIEKLGSIRLEWVPREENYAGLWLEGKLRPFSVERLREQPAKPSGLSWPVRGPDCASKKGFYDYDGLGNTIL